MVAGAARTDGQAVLDQRGKGPARREPSVNRRRVHRRVRVGFRSRGEPEQDPVPGPDDTRRGPGDVRRERAVRVPVQHLGGPSSGRAEPRVVRGAAPEDDVGQAELPRIARVLMNSQMGVPRPGGFPGGIGVPGHDDLRPREDARQHVQGSRTESGFRVRQRSG